MFINVPLEREFTYVYRYVYDMYIYKNFTYLFVILYAYMLDYRYFGWYDCRVICTRQFSQ
jgi:hypothetical protein